MTFLFTKTANVDKLADEILVGIGKKLKENYQDDPVDGYITFQPPTLKIEFNNDLSAGEITSLNQIVSDHTP
jgi:hypothetical protein